MLATQTPDVPQEAKHVKQIKEKLAQSLKALQMCYVTSDAVVTSEDADANLLCCALEAIFIHGIKSKYIRQEAGGRSRKGDRGLLPQPFFWSLLKTVTHRNVITELEKISFVGTDVGRCRAWLRLALNDGLLWCYLESLFRESSKLRAHYQPGALLLNEEERDVLLSYLQGLSSLSFSLSYKSAVLNEWTTTPLSLAGLCPLAQADTLGPPVNGTDHAASKPACKDSWDTVSQSSGSSDAPVVLVGRGSGGFQGGTRRLNSSSLSLDTTGSSQLSSSLSSDSLLHGQDPCSPAGDQWSSCDLDPTWNGSSSTKQTLKDSLPKLQEHGNCSQDSMCEDSFVSSNGPDQFSDSDQPPSSILSDAEPPPSTADPPSPGQNRVDRLPSEGSTADPLPRSKPVYHEQPVVHVPEKEVEDRSESSVRSSCRRSPSVLSRNLSTDSLTRSRSWISEDDIYKPHVDEESDQEEAPPAAPSDSQSPPCVVHRRQIGLSNPFRGLLKLGHLERRGAMGMWRDHFCELSPFEFRLYLNAEERMCCDNCSLLRCEDARLTSPDGRFELVFPSKRLHLRATNRDEAEDWVDRIVEAVNKCRPVSRVDEQWEVLEAPSENGVDDEAFSSTAPCIPERSSSSDFTAPTLHETNWTRTTDLETDAIKEAVLYCSVDPDARTWNPLVLSLSLESLKGFRVQEGRKLLQLSVPIEEVRDVVPDVSLGGPNFFKLLTLRETLRLRAENTEEARSWRILIRGALDSYLESGEEAELAVAAAVGHSGAGNIHRLVQHRLKEDGALLAHLCTVPPQKGLDTQNFKCAGCPQQIGPSLGRGRLCEFSGRYYCDSCHRGDISIIPSRMVHNWDLNKREVSKKALWLLAQVEQEPLLNLDQLNPDLTTHTESMARIHSLRQRLQLLGDYLLTCRSGACKTLQTRMEQRTYLLESSVLYSVLDLRQIAEKQYAAYLMSLCQFACSHVFRCELCTQRGFICQMCHASDIIFPFQFDSTARCKACKAVFHRACMAPGRCCPRCLRMKKYLDRDLQD
ncbi:pleckstrin homology domain-containing family M member 1 [Dunckerocampus dactyliophorus]|uniref:pleckstrin homology domain-containing family M member 1 n=1 Tax=Dunckerocampus dactyliophorus TaxID=161453 RepID=UPI0024055021|nr:pleckstrin homology domain-containing family M member 1 [Dunckerocampus dactyliophorus]XP_054609064.1 pleckstrin homology domain-containing family M member 1 [Dunckerocampus dactyliophorus]XP_054609065.1 pleckstrin homology domain-containing family M member 1 [Dunckerocampus dactyliophorus]